MHAKNKKNAHLEDEYYSLINKSKERKKKKKLGHVWNDFEIKIIRYKTTVRYAISYNQN